MKLGPYRGTQDLYPERVLIRNYIYDVWKKNASLYMFQEYSGPLLESVELYLMKTSEEIVNEQLYSLTDKKDRKLVIRPEMTPTMARMIANKMNQLNFPLRWFSIENCMRYERPQRGRFREFSQLNMDLIGGEESQSDKEILLSIPTMLKSFGAKESEFKVKISHRKLMDSFLKDQLNLDKDQTVKTIRLLDAFKKRSVEDTSNDLSELGLNSEQVEGIINLMTKSPTSLLEGVKAGESSPEYINILSQLNESIKELNSNYSTDVFEIDFTILRGFDYYTGIVFEVLDVDPQNRRSLFGGGRFDNLISDLGGKPVSGVGYGVSETSIYNFLEVRDLLPEIEVVPQVVASCAATIEGDGALDRFINNLRLKNITVLKLFGENKVNKILKRASKLKSRFAVFVGPLEIEKNVLIVKDMEEGIEHEFGASDDFDSFLEKIGLKASL